MSAIGSTLGVLLLPVVIPYLRRAYWAVRQARSQPSRSATTSEKCRLLAIACLVAFHITSILRYLLLSKTGDLFRATNSRFAVPTDVLRNRASQVPHLAPLSEGVWSLLESAEGRLLYLNLGAGPLESCRWCTLDNPQSYFWFVSGKIGLLYLGQLALVAVLCAGDRTPWSVASLVLFALECVVRVGGADDFNIAAKRSTDILPLHEYIPAARHALFAIELLLVAAQTVFFIRYFAQQPSLAQARIDLLLGIECLRVGNSAARATHDVQELDAHAASYWRRQRELQQKYNADPDVVQARQDVRERLGTELAVEKQRLKQFVERLWSIR